MRRISSCRCLKSLSVVLLLLLFVPENSGYAYEPDFHYAWTYYLALHVGYTRRQAFQIASAAFSVDMDKDTGPMEATPGDVLFGANIPG